MKSHFSLNGGVAVACAVAGASTFLNGDCSAATFVAADYATNSTYAAGWSAGQNGGYGFGPWSMDYTGGSSTNIVTLQNVMDTNSPFDPFGVAWTLYNPQGTPPESGNSPGGLCDNPPTGTDISRAGRAIPGGLQVGQTFSTVFANPSTRTFYRGYTIVLSNGSDNIQYGGAGSLLSVGTFEFFSYGRWYASGANGLNQGYTGTTLFDTDTTTNGMEVDITVTDTNNDYYIVMTPLNNPANAFSETGTFATNGPASWITYQLYNTDSDFYNYNTNSYLSYPTNAPCGPDPTDFYIKSMTIAALTLNIQMVSPNVILSWTTNVTGFNLESTTNLAAAVWNTNSTTPVVVNGQNVVTNPIAGTRQFYRLQQ
jgi:hypothetical protein